MTEQAGESFGALAPSLRAKIEAFAADLSPEERAHLGSLPLGSAPLDDVIGMLAPSVAEKAQRVAATLTSEEQAQIAQALEAADAAGYMMKQREGVKTAQAERAGSWGPQGNPGVLGMVILGFWMGAQYSTTFEENYTKEPL